MLRPRSTLLLWACCAIVSGQLPDDVLLLSRIRREAIASLQTIPSYTCLETIRRGTRRSPKQPYREIDTIELEVAEIDHRELFSWPGQKGFDDKTAQIYGLSSNGEFASYLNNVMSGWAAIRYAGKQECLGHPAVRYNYTMAQAFSGWNLNNAGRHAITAESGSFWADPESATLYRLVANAEQIPLFLGILSAQVDIRYAQTALAAPGRDVSARDGAGAYLSSATRPVLLPQSYSVHMVLDTGEDQRNDASFTHCREYNVESKLVAEPASPPDAPKDQVKEIQLPPHLTFKVKLLTSLQSGYNRVGDRIQAKLEADVRSKGRVIVPKDADLIGRVRRLEHYFSPHEYWVGALEFTGVAFIEDGHIVHAGFFGKLLAYDAAAGVERSIEREQVTDEYPGVLRRTRREKLFPGELPGVGTFLAEGASFSLKPGFQMTWITTALAKPAP